jgi:hypothetical protein
MKSALGAGAENASLHVRTPRLEVAHFGEVDDTLKTAVGEFGGVPPEG